MRNFFIFILKSVSSGHLMCMLSMVAIAKLFGKKPNLKADN